jgi:hypothetical protein
LAQGNEGVGREGLDPQEAAPDRVEWGSGDIAPATAMWTGLPPNSTSLLELLIAEGEMDGESIVQRLGLNDVSQVTGVAGRVGRVAKRVGRTSPIKSRTLAEGTVWRVEPDAAQLFKQVSEP